MKIILGDTIEEMNKLPDKSVRLICADLPYGTTRNKWDVIIPFASLWEQYERIIMDNGAIVLFGQGLFSAKLILSNESLYRYSIVWEKTEPTGFYNARIMPLRNHEDIHVFYKKPPVYIPQKTTGHPRKVSTAHHKRNSKQSTNYGTAAPSSYDSTERYPKSVWKFASDKQKKALHPTQKPVALIEQIIKTYSYEGDMVLDNTCGSGTTGEACRNLKRDCILIDNDPTSIEITISRLSPTP